MGTEAFLLTTVSYPGDLTLLDFLKEAEYQAWSILHRDRECRPPQDAVLGDQQMAYFAVSRHRSTSAKGQQHALAGALAQIKCQVKELQYLQLSARASLFISVAQPQL